MDLGGKFTHHLGCSGNFANGFFFHSQACNQRSRHDGRQLAIHDHAHDLEHFVVKNFTVLNGSLKCFLRCDGHVVL